MFPPWVCVWMGEGQRERKRENPKKARSYQHKVDMGSNSQTHVRSWLQPKPRVRCLTNCTTQKPLVLPFFFYLFKKNFFRCLFIFEKETEHELGWGRERGRQSVGGSWGRERETQNPKQVPGSDLSAQSLTRGWNPQTARSWPEQESKAQLTEPPRCMWCLHYSPMCYTNSLIARIYIILS